jgi:hypothetical protein
MRSPDDALVIVCGSKARNFAMIGIPWGLSKAVSRPVMRKDGSPVRKSSAVR